MRFEWEMGKTNQRGPHVRTDMVTVFVFRRGVKRGIEWLQLLRAERPGKIMAGTWQPVAGGIKRGESATEAARREAREETGLTEKAIAGMWQCDEVHPFYLAARDVIMLAPAFAVEVGSAWRPKLNEEHSTARWVKDRDAEGMFMWPGQRAAIREIRELILRADSPAREALRSAGTERQERE